MTDRYLYIIARTNPGLFDVLSEQFAGDPTVTVILDRRQGERRENPRGVEAAERRQRDRRRNLDVEEALRVRSYAVVTVPA
jgi:hypothetical protein